MFFLNLHNSPLFIFQDECTALPVLETVTDGGDLVAPQKKLPSVSEKDGMAGGDDGSMTGLQLQKMLLELEDDEYAPCTTVGAPIGLEPQEMPAVTFEHYGYAPCSTVPTDPGPQKKKSAFEACVAPCATVGDLTSQTQKTPTLEEKQQYAPFSTVSEFIPQKTSPNLEKKKHISYAEEEEEDSTSKQLTMLPEECGPPQITVANSPMKEQPVIPRQTISVPLSIPTSAATAAQVKKEELNNEER